MKRILVLMLFSVVFPLMLICCKGDILPGDENQDDNNGNNGESGGKFDIVMVAKHDGLPWFEDMENGVEEFGEAYSDKVNVRQVAPADGDGSKQVLMVEDLIAQEVDAICVNPIDPEAMKPLLVRAKERGIVVISHDAPGLAETVDYNIEAFYNCDFGELLFDTLAKEMGGAGEFVVMVGNKKSQTEMEWYDTGMSYIAENYPNMQMVLEQPAEDNHDDETAHEKAVWLLKAYPDIKGFLGTTVTAGANFAGLLKERNNRNIKVVSVGTPSVSGEHLKSGFMAQSHIWRPADLGYVTCLVALKVIRGETIENDTDLEKDGYHSISIEDKMIYGNAPLVLVAENVDDYPF